MTSTIDDFEDNFDDLDEFDDDERGVSGFVVLLIILAMLLAFSFIVWLAYDKGIRHGVAARDVPYVAADPEPVKRASIEASGANAVPEREVYDRIDGRASTATEVLSSGPEEPIVAESGDQIADLAAAAAQAAADGDDTVRTVGDSAVRYESAQAEKLDDVIRGAVAEAEPAPVGPSDTPSVAPPSRGATTVTKTSSQTARPVVTPPTTARATAGGSHVVQVGAFRTEAEADRFWSNLNNKFGTYLDGKGKDIEFADLGAKGVYYRLRIAGFEDGDAASGYCAGLKARSQDCLVKKR